MNVRRQFRRRFALTLVEVIAGLVLLTTVLSAVFIARGRFLQQFADAERKLQATRAVDSMIGQWLAGPVDRVPLNGSGFLEGVSGCRWTTSRVTSGEARNLDIRIVRLEVQRTEPALPTADRLVLAVEFALPQERVIVPATEVPR